MQKLEILVEILKIRSLYSQYIFSISLFVVKYKDQRKYNQEVHNLNSRCGMNLHPPRSSLEVY
jgi:hypothetical protein